MTASLPLSGPPLLPSLPFLTPYEAPLPTSPPPPPLLIQAYNHHLAGDFSSAIPFYSQLVSARPEAVLNLGVCYLRQGHIAQARRLYILSSISTPEITFNYALATLLLGKKHEAIKAFHNCVLTATEEPLRKCAEAAISTLQAQSPMRTSSVLWKTEPDFEFSMVVRSGPPSKKVRSASSLGGTQYHQCHLQRGTLSQCGKRSRLLNSTLDVTKPDRKQRRLQTKAVLSRLPTVTVDSNVPKQSRCGLNSLSVCDLETHITIQTDKARRMGSFIAEDLEDAMITQQVVEAGRDIHTAVVDFDQQLTRVCKKPVLTQAVNVPPGKKMKPEEIKKVREEMRKPGIVRDLSVLVAIVTRIKFFEKFKADVRRELLRVGGLLSIPQNQFVFHQGEISSHVYVILKGSISVWRDSIEYGSEPLIVNTLYEGESFGDLSLFTDTNTKEVGRTASCQAVEDTDLYYLEKDEYQRIMIREVEISLQAKLSFLLKLPFFTGINEFVLVPLAATLTPFKYKIGQYILHTGEVPKGLHIIVSGRCNVCSEGYSLTPKAKHAVQPGTTSPYGVSWTVVPDSKRGDRSDSILTRKTVEADERLQKELKAFFRVDSLQKILAEYVIYRERVIEDVLPVGSYFAGRCLVVASITRVTPSKFSIIADSAEAVMYVFTSRQMPLLGEKLASHVTRILAKYGDPDCPVDVSRDKVRKDFLQWRDFKLKTISRVLRHRPPL